jgi:hypothetical protein
MSTFLDHSFSSFICLRFISPAAGATRLTYAPEPFDVGQLLQAEIVLKADKVTVQTDGPINPG